MNSPKWNKVNACWYQKYFINDKNQFVCSYHYKKKSSKAAKVIQVELKIVNGV
jgi:hypothetical protein